MNLDIVLEWMKTFDGKVTPGAVQRKFGVGIWYANRIYDLLVKGGHVKDEKRMNHIVREAKREAAEEMYDMLNEILVRDLIPRSKEQTLADIKDLLKKARCEK